MAANNDDLISEQCDKALAALANKYWEAYDDPDAGNEVWVLKKQLQDATLEWAKTKVKMVTPDTLTTQSQLEQATQIRVQMEEAQHATDVIVVAARFIAFVATV
jgi:hypothetical protein